MSLRNIVITGETGVGKSSLINLIVGKDKAGTSNDAVGVTLGVTRHYWRVDAQTFRLYDTPGLNEGEQGSVPTKRAEEALRTLLTQLDKASGVQLLIFCFRGISKVTKVTKRTFDVIQGICDKLSCDIPILAIVTELEKYSASVNGVSSMEEWWKSNGKDLLEDNRVVCGYACITSAPDDRHPDVPGRRDYCQRLVRDRILTHALPPKFDTTKDTHIILFGETGVGKSSLIDLIAGDRIANVSPDAQGCTLESKEYQIKSGSSMMRLWDTVGLQEPELGAKDCVGAIEKAIQLIRKLNAVGGASLLLFCIRGNRITATTQSNYKLFYDVLGRKEIPIALAITHLEAEDDMKAWWPRNVKTLEKYGIFTAGHACITAIEGHRKYSESKDAVQDLLSKYSDQGKFSMPSEDWITRVLRSLRELVFGNKGFPKGEGMVNILTKRCQLAPEMARRVASCLDES